MKNAKAIIPVFGFIVNTRSKRNQRKKQPKLCNATVIVAPRPGLVEMPPKVRARDKEENKAAGTSKTLKESMVKYYVYTAV